ncbi:MAG: MMPL family transporter, partial [Anaerolineae bacterium]|nr:MMPL family transporter [Anaerolineae bacterium]
GSTVIVIDATEAGGVLDREADTFAGQRDTATGRFIDRAADWLVSDSAPENVTNISVPTSSPATAALMVSDDNRVAMVNVHFSTSNPEDETTEAMAAIDDWLIDNRPAGVLTYQTGEAPIVSNTANSVTTSVDRTIWVTVGLVVVILLWIYRSPVSPLVPLFAVTVAYLITRGIVAYLGAHYMTITSYANVMVVVVMYGAGTDYCLFLISRFREEMADHIGLERATARTVHLVGETITSSAGTIFVGFMSMIFAEMGIFNTSGPALAIGIVMSLLAGLTFVPALLATLGEHAFWPRKATHRDTGQFYEMTSKFVSSRPLIAILVIVAIMTPFSVYGLNQRTTYNMLGDLPEDKPAVVGYELLQETLGAGNAMPLTVVVTDRAPDRTAAEIAQLTREIAAIDGVADVRGLNTPLGQRRNTDFAAMLGAQIAEPELLRVDTQLRLALGLMAGLGSQTSTDEVDLPAVMAALEGVQGYLDLLVERFPAVADDPNLLTIEELLGNPLTLAARGEELAAAIEGLAERFGPDADDPIPDPYLLLTGLDSMLSALPDTGAGGSMLSNIIASYLTNNGTAFKLDVILGVRPTGYEAMDIVSQIRDILKDYRDGGEAVASGGGATTTDIRDTMDRDLLRAIGFVLLGIFIVLLLMLRSLIAPLYLIGTVLLSFTCTLGLTNFVFQTLWDIEGLTWYVPFFMFVFLVGLGMDYSIFLFGRIKEEVAHHGIREGVHVAVARTGAIITSAGIILAGTFAAMMTGEIKGLIEMGFAVSVGVLIDTFVVRTMLDPALATLFDRWTWWPGGVPQVRPSRGAAQD